jgi:hypothetical protein
MIKDFMLYVLASAYDAWRVKSGKHSIFKGLKLFK